MAKTKGIYKRGKIYWIRYTGSDGKKRFESSGSTSKKIAAQLLIKRKNEVLEGKDQVKKIKNYTFNELATHYLKWIEHQKAFKNKKAHIIQLINHFGSLSLNKISILLIEEYQTKMILDNKANATINRHLSTLKHMFAKAIDWEMATDDLLVKAKKVKSLPENNKRLRYLSKEEYHNLINACSPHLKPIVITALNTGMRREEILSLEWKKNVDLNNGFILLDKTKNNERREIPINQTLKETLQNITININSPYVFIDKHGNRYKDVKKSFKTACKKANITDFRFHDQRHTYASYLVMIGVDLTSVKELLGHKSLNMTLRYSHLAPSHKVKAVEMLDNSLNKVQSIQKVYNSKK